jgi:hypothetical protein
MNIAALAATALLAAAPVGVTDGAPTPTPTPTVEYVPLDQVPGWYTTKPYMHTGVCMITEYDITCATDTQWKRVTFHDRYTQALYKFIRKEPTMNQLTTITDVYDEIRNALGEYAGDFNIEGIANDAYIFNPATQTFEPSSTTPFWAAVEANANANTQGN